MSVIEIGGYSPTEANLKEVIVRREKERQEALRALELETETRREAIRREGALNERIFSGYPTPERDAFKVMRQASDKGPAASRRVSKEEAIKSLDKVRTYINQ